MANNPNWPLIEDGWAPYWNANGGAPWDRFVEVTGRTMGTGGSQRGRQYELDQVRTGELSLTLANTDGVLDPTNSSGPFYGHVAPYQPYRKRAMWPPSINLLSQIMATGGDLGGYAVGANVYNADIFSDTDPTFSGIIVTSATAYQGSNVLQFGVPSGSAVGARICRTMEPAVLPGQTYTMQMRIRNVTPSTTLQVKAGIGWYLAPLAPATSFTYGSTVTLTGSATASWTLITVTATAPAGAMAVDIDAVVAATAAATCSIQVDAWQFEKGGSASAWVQPGVWYPMYEGFVERWTPTWKYGTYGTVSPTAVDAFALLSQVKLDDPLTEAINAASPRFAYRLDDPAGSTTFTEAFGAYNAAGIARSKYGPGVIAAGTQITATDPLNGIFTGSSGTVTTFTNPSPGQGGGFASSVIDLTTAGITGPTNPASWTRCVAFRYTGPTPTDAACIWSSMDRQHAATGLFATGSRIFLSIFPDGHLHLVIGGPTGSFGNTTFTANNGSFPNVLDGNWHLAIFGWNQAAGEIRTSLDGNNWFFTGFTSAITPTGLVSDSLGAWYDIGLGGAAGDNWQGDIAFACEFSSYLFNNNTDAIYAAWKNSFTGESTDARYSRILQYAGSTALSNIQTGLTTSMGPAAFGGQDALTALQAVVDTENGEHFVGTNGRVNFRSRAARYNALTPAYTFGENVAAGEFPYEDCQLDYDPTHLANQITVTQSGTGQTFAAQDATSIQAYMPRTLTRSINSSSAAECQDAADYLLSRYKQPSTRVSSLKLHPSAYPALWPVVLGLELGTRVRVMRRPPNLNAIQIECFVESIKIDWDDNGEATVTLQCSPADTTPYAIFAAWHTTLKTTVASGVTSITINNSQDNTNPLASQLAAGTQIVLGQNTANQETVTVSAVGVTSTGWTSAVITLTAATTKAHTAGDLISEVLPAGTTDPTTWDAVAALDAVAFAY
ncbi:hypothetical protein GCM10010331_49030 [Streptomyces xanthochromogenes]|uniref:hypothetical protein n=1 Tax=Streptomyces xanthochromogenes TaxID=67384 RepID=UPI001674725E|nr:hypothetical protein [Streptomyces xanthochromogenes]GHB55400.1 hypothetical protein GCM10010331_49030 [Streptomyces xanthochromogenes]